MSHPNKMPLSFVSEGYIPQDAFLVFLDDKTEVEVYLQGNGWVSIDNECYKQHSNIVNIRVKGVFKPNYKKHGGMYDL